jgi:hypothetical protein
MLLLVSLGAGGHVLEKLIVHRFHNEGDFYRLGGPAAKPVST